MQAIPSGQDRPILPAQVANHRIRFILPARAASHIIKLLTEQDIYQLIIDYPISRSQHVTFFRLRV